MIQPQLISLLQAPFFSFYMLGILLSVKPALRMDGTSFSFKGMLISSGNAMTDKR